MRVEIRHSPDQLGSLHIFHSAKTPAKTLLNCLHFLFLPMEIDGKRGFLGPFDRFTLFAFCSVSYSAQIPDTFSIVYSKLRSDPDQHFCRSPLSWRANNDQSWAQPAVLEPINSLYLKTSSGEDTKTARFSKCKRTGASPGVSKQQERTQSVSTGLKNSICSGRLFFSGWEWFSNALSELCHAMSAILFLITNFPL